MKITSILGEKLQLPWIRRPKESSLFEGLMTHLGWSLNTSRNSNSSLRSWNVYYQAMNNVWVNSSINAFIDEILSLGFGINNHDSENVDYANVKYLTELFENPMGLFEDDTFTTFTSQTWRSFMGLGNTFIEVIYDTGFKGVPIGLNYLPCEIMKYHDDTSQWGLINNPDIRFENDQLIQVKEPTLDKRKWGSSPIDNISGEIANILWGNRHVRKQLKNKGFDPKGVLSFDKDMEYNQVLSEINRLKKEPDKKGTIVTKGANFIRGTVSNREMDYIELQHEARDCILANYGVPPSKVSIIETGNIGSGSGKSQAENFKKRVIGRCKYFEDAYKKVLGRSSFSETFVYNRADLEDKLQKAQIENIRINNNSLTINEARSKRGEPRLEWGDKPINNNSLSALIQQSNMPESNHKSVISDPASKDLIKYKHILKEQGLIA
ncbi:phage portal protein [Methanobrevibacter sp.]|uniref:phage portal protein n=1 Tax=Methanobrevibacter sp. TaxID=66852 RepID=UPI00261527DB|nr:phage portal protein [uncultured Methanobrevibacter sp.]